MRASKNIQHNKFKKKRLGNEIRFDLLDIYDNSFFLI